MLIGPVALPLRRNQKLSLGRAAWKPDKHRWARFTGTFTKHSITLFSCSYSTFSSHVTCALSSKGAVPQRRWRYIFMPSRSAVHGWWFALNLYLMFLRDRGHRGETCGRGALRIQAWISQTYCTTHEHPHPHTHTQSLWDLGEASGGLG